MARRKLDDVEGSLFRVVQRPKGSEEEWVPSNYGTYGRPRTYTTLGAARGQKTQYERKQAEDYEWRKRTSWQRQDMPKEFEFAVQRAPVVAWEIVGDD